jgi:hypothetical protein
MYTKILTYLLPLAIPMIMFWSAKSSRVLERIYHVLALASLYLFTVTVGLYVLDTIYAGKVYSTTIHGILLNPFFLLPGGYFGMYVLYQLLRLIFAGRPSFYSK